MHDFNQRLIAWQHGQGRHDLPWQVTDPYRVWLSEIMLQQTQVRTVLAYYERFLARFPSVEALASAAPEEVLGLWSGLGYYSRARNLHRCAQCVVQKWGGQFPRQASDLQTLPGIGPSTAAAIAAFCFDERISILDGNVRRSLSRLCAFDGDLSRAQAVDALWDLAQTWLPERAADMPDYTQGLMDLGALVCTPRNPRCEACPVQPLCEAHAQGQVLSYPVRTRRLRRSSEAWWWLCVFDAQGRIWLAPRPDDGIWPGLHAPPIAHSEAELEQLVHAAGLADTPWQPWPVIAHALTHKDLHLHPMALHLNAAQARRWQRQAHTQGQGQGQSQRQLGQWYAVPDWASLGLPAPVRKWLAALGGMG